jgi:serine/threonine protein kinase
MNCHNENCSKVLKSCYTCSRCGKNFCTNICMTSHIFEKHNNETFTTTNDNTIVRNSSHRSIFMKQGQFLKEIIDDPLYSFKNFELLQNVNNPIGTGAFGEVFLAKNKLNNQNYAIKIMEKSKITETGMDLEVIYREISIHRRLMHDNIVKVYNHYEDKENVYLIMEYMNAGTIFNLIKKNRGIDEYKAFRYFIQAVSAVYFLHQNSLVHRDLKPENLLLDKDDNLKLCDFGWCVDVSSGTRQTFCGTYEYMAPELIKEIPYDYAIDVWSLGILLYEMLHGYSPFRSQTKNDEDYAEIFKNIIKYNFKIEKDISKNCKDLIESKIIYI